MLELGYCISGYLNGLETFISNPIFEDYRFSINQNYGRSVIKKVWVLDTNDFIFSDDLILKCSRISIGNDLYFGFNSYKRILDAEKRGAYISYMLVIKNATAEGQKVYDLLVKIENLFENCIVNNVIDKSLLNTKLSNQIDDLIFEHKKDLDLIEIDKNDGNYEFYDSIITCREFFRTEGEFFNLVYSMNTNIMKSMVFVNLNSLSESKDSSKYKFLGQRLIEEIRSRTKVNNTNESTSYSYIKNIFFSKKPETITLKKSEYEELKNKLSNKDSFISALRQKITEYETQFREYRKIIYKKDKQINDLKNEIEECKKLLTVNVETTNFSKVNKKGFIKRTWSSLKSFFSRKKKITKSRERSYSLKRFWHYFSRIIICLVIIFLFWRMITFVIETIN